MTRELELGLLDLCWIPPGGTAATTLADMTELVTLADRLGFTRYWLAEHHSSTVAHASPELLLPLLAGMTNRIRVGVGGVLLSYRSPLKVASDFRLLETLFPGRIDLGLGRGGVPRDTAEALLHGRSKDVSDQRFDAMFEDVVRFLTGTIPPEHPNYQARVSPQRLLGAMPQVFGLGTTRHTLHITAEQGASFAYALFIANGGEDPEVFEEYRRRFKPGALGTGPWTVLSVAGVCAETDEEAELICRRDCDGVIPSVVGSVEHCRAGLLGLRDRYRADEVVFLEIARPLSDRLRSCDLLSRALEPGTLATAH